MTTPTQSRFAFPGDLIEHKIGSTAIRVQWLETGPYHVSVWQGPNREQAQSFFDEIDALAYARGLAEMYRDLANGAPNDAAAFGAPAIPAPITNPTVRTPLAAALANLHYAGWSVAKLAAELGVSRSAVYRWRKGATPNDTNTAALIRLSTDLGDRGAACGCRGYGRVHTGWQYVNGQRVETYGRCACNPKESKVTSNDANESAESSNNCPVCTAPLGEHIGGKPCITSEPRKIGGWYNLPMAAEMWREDGRDLRA